MNRRSYLATLGSLGAMLPLAGCAAFGEGNDSSTDTAPTVEQGEMAIISVEGTDVESIRIGMMSEGPNVSDSTRYPEFQYEDAEFTPRYDLYLKSRPLIWQWSSPVSVEGKVPLQTHSNTPPGTYEFPVSISKAGSDEGVTRRSTVTVE